MSFKTDYVDASWSGSRKYTITMNGTATKNATIDDTTAYEKVGSQIGAKQFNEIGKELNRINTEKTVTLSASKWSSSAPYSQTVSVEGCKSTDIPIVQCGATSATSAANTKVYRKMFGYIDDVVTGNGTVTFYCNQKKPTSDFQVRLVGVSA